MIVQNKKILASILFVLISFVCTAQPNGMPPPPAPPPPPGLPIDNTIIVLFFLALALGIYKNFKKVKS
ncbi:MAG: hypothetical protein R2812_02470 [Gelidibacter sp.]